ncbi:MAG: A/G-specific adenine glycosylase [Bacteroidetes bacterium]|nr:A/G-specific adenine glycosylase [Bacteroidota bacterium]
MAASGKYNDRLFFTEKLLEWHAGHHRPMPWKGERDPYLVWLSEIILQQTRVEQGLPYFEKFKAAYPTVRHLADAPEDEVMKFWEGLGYYSRARNLHAAAKQIAYELNGTFPATYEGIRSLKGVGDYTAAAIASFAFDLPHAVVDGNVYRVLARYFGIGQPIDSSEGKKRFAQLAQQLLEISDLGFRISAASLPKSEIPNPKSNHNQAIMDFGAMHCTPAAPKCPTCPMKPHCEAFQQQNTAQLPVKSKKPERRQRFFNYLIINQNGNFFIKKRTEKDIWQNLYDFPLIETATLPDDRNDLTGHVIFRQWFGENGWRLVRVSAPIKQQLTHQRIIATFCEMEVEDDFSPKKAGWQKVEKEKLSDFAFPKIIDLYFQKKFLPLEIF